MEGCCTLFEVIVVHGAFRFNCFGKSVLVGDEVIVLSRLMDFGFGGFRCDGD